MNPYRIINTGLVVLSLLMLVGCAQSLVDVNKEIVSDCAPNQVVIEVKGDQVKDFCVRVADDDIERAKGLMYVDELPEDEGMLFVFPEEDYRSFWMMNTLIPLDILFFNSDGDLVDVKNNFQPCENSLNCRAYQSQGKAKYVLEVSDVVYEEGVDNLQLVLGQ